MNTGSVAPSFELIAIAEAAKHHAIRFQRSSIFIMIFVFFSMRVPQALAQCHLLL